MDSNEREFLLREMYARTGVLLQFEAWILDTFGPAAAAGRWLELDEIVSAFPLSPHLDEMCGVEAQAGDVLRSLLTMLAALGFCFVEREYQPVAGSDEPAVLRERFRVRLLPLAEIQKAAAFAALFVTQARRSPPMAS